MFSSATLRVEGAFWAPLLGPRGRVKGERGGGGGVARGKARSRAPLATRKFGDSTSRRLQDSAVLPA